MLAIENQPLYKNKLVLSAVAVIVGFIVTVAIIRGFSSNTSNAQSTAQPIEVLSASEQRDAKTNDKDSSSTSTGNDQGASNQGTTLNPSGTAQQPVSSSQPAATGNGTRTSSGSPSSSPSTAPPSSGGGSTSPGNGGGGSGGSGGGGTPTPPPSPPQCTVNILGICI